jgi:hypothetical protein
VAGFVQSQALLVDVLVAAAIGLPIAPLGTTWWKIASQIQGQFPEQLGWPELVDTVAQIRNSLPPGQRAHTSEYGISTANALSGHELITSR